MRLYEHHSLRLYSKCWGYMQVFAEAICKMLRLYAGLCENIDHLSPVEAGAGTELGNKNINVFLWSWFKIDRIWFGFTPEPLFNFRAIEKYFSGFCWGYMHFAEAIWTSFAEAIFKMLRLYELFLLMLFAFCWGYLLRCENKDHLSLVELGNKVV